MECPYDRSCCNLSCASHFTSRHMLVYRGGNSDYQRLGVEWPVVLELVVTIWWNKFVHLMASSSDTVAPADNVRQWMYPYLRDTKGSVRVLLRKFLILA